MTFTSREPNVGPEEAPGHVLHLRVKSRTNAADLVLAEAAGAESLRDAGHLAGADAAAVHLDRKHGPCFGGYCDMLVDKRERHHTVALSGVARKLEVWVAPWALTPISHSPKRWGFLPIRVADKQVLPKYWL